MSPYNNSLQVSSAEKRKNILVVASLVYIPSFTFHCKLRLNIDVGGWKQRVKYMPRCFLGVCRALSVLNCVWLLHLRPGKIMIPK